MSDIVKASSLHKSKAPPELHLHAAATLVVHGDPFNANPDLRQDKTGEIAQFAVIVQPQFVGRLKRTNIDEAFDNLKKSIVDKLRKHGVMAAGE